MEPRTCNDWRQSVWVLCSALMGPFLSAQSQHGIHDANWCHDDDAFYLRLPPTVSNSDFGSKQNKWLIGYLKSLRSTKACLVEHIENRAESLNNPQLRNAYVNHCKPMSSHKTPSLIGSIPCCSLSFYPPLSQIRRAILDPCFCSCLAG